MEAVRNRLDRLRGRARVSVVAVLALLVAPLAAGATPIEVIYDGPTFGMPEHFGLSMMTKDAAVAAGLAVLDIPLLALDPTNPDFEVVTQILDVASIVQPVTAAAGTPVRASSTWTVRANASDASPLERYLVFVTTKDYIGTAGLRIDAADGWVLVHAQFGGTDLYYPAVRMGFGSTVAVGDTTSTNVHYVVNQNLNFVSSTTQVLPQFMLGLATTSVPEPGTALLLLFGMGGLAWFRPIKARNV